MEVKYFAGAGKRLSRAGGVGFALVAVALVFLWAASGGDAAPQNLPAAPRVRTPAAAVLAAYGQLPLSFEPNVGQTDPRVRFLAHGERYALFLTDGEAVLALRGRSTGSTPAIRMRMLGAQPARDVRAVDRQEGVSNYVLGNDRRRWRTGVPHYGRVQFQNVYRGVHLVYYGTRSGLEYDFLVSPGADPAQIRVRIDGASRLTVDGNGDLRLQAGPDCVVLRRPDAYQHTRGGREAVRAGYKRLASNVYGFSLGPYDRRRELLIDPQLIYSTYLGGTGDETAPSVAVDSAFNAYIAGTTTSTDFPTMTPQQGTNTGTPSNLFISKLSPAGNTLLYSTYLGGSGLNQGAGIAVDSKFFAFVTGSTTAADFPVLHAFQSAPKAPGQHAFVAALNASGALAYSTYLSGSSTDLAAGIALNPTATGKPFVAGRTQSTDFPTTPGTLQPSLAAGVTSAFFVAKLDTTASGSASLVYSTYVAGTQPAGATVTGGAIAVDSVGNAYLAGGTNFIDYPVVNAIHATPAGRVDVVVTKLNKTGTRPPIYSTYLGGTGDDIANGLAVDFGGNAYLTGSTTSTDYPTLAAAGTAIFQSANAGGADAFVSKLSSAGALVYSTYLGGSGADAGNAIAVDPAQFAYVTGTTASANFKTLSALFPAAPGGGSDAFLAKFDTSGTAQFSTYLGGSGADHGTGVATDALSDAFVVGDTTSANFPVIAGSYRTTPVGGSDGFVSKMTGVADLAVTAAVTPSPVGIGNPATFTYTITNNGPDAAAGVVLTDTLPAAGATLTAAASAQGSCAAPTGSPSTVACSVGAIAVGGTATVSIQLSPSAASPLTNSATLSSSTIDNNAANNTASATVPVTDFTLSAGPTSTTVAAGQAASYTVTISPQPPGAAFTSPVSLTCAAGLPGSTTCIFSTNPVTPNATPVTSSLTVTTIARPATARAFPRTLRFYALFAPLAGFAVLGAAGRRKRRARLALLAVVTALLLQGACGSSSKTTPATGGTPAGTYTVTVQGTSGSVSRSAAVTLKVE